MAIDQTLVPAYISVTYDGTELNIVDAKLSLKYNNQSKYEEAMTSTGKKGYMLRKGVSVLQEGEIYVVLTKTADGKQDDNISSLQKIAQEIAKSEKPDDYSKNIAIIVKNPAEEQFLSVTFNGYLKEINTQPSDKGNFFTDYVAVFQIFDPLSIKISN
jgi:hypothetical protein